MRIREPMSLLCAAVIAAIIGGEAAAQVANAPPNDPQPSAVRSGAPSGTSSADSQARSKKKDSGGTSSEEEASLATITVTALRHEESISNVPVAVSAVTADELTIQNALQVRDVAQLAPGLNITTDSPARAFISMRGIGITVLSSVQPGVGVFVDGIYEPDTGYLNSPLLNVERIEVLRGPQGTLFGSNTEGGAINVITKQPGNTWEGKASADYAGPD
ncbi:MAG: TonB-dependent receptor plug domain-containing protein, partial [Steroidobacteraceae bacterium]